MNMDFYLTMLVILGPFMVGVLKKKSYQDFLYTNFYKQQLHKTNLNDFFIV